MSVSKPILIRTIILSLTIMAALIVINFALITLGSSIGIKLETITFDILALIIVIIVAFLSLIFFGSLVEYMDKEPNLIVAGISYIIPAILAYYSKLFRDNTRILITVILLGLVFLYFLIAEER